MTAQQYASHVYPSANKNTDKRKHHGRHYPQERPGSTKAEEGWLGERTIG